MGIRRWVAEKDTVITNAFKENLTTRATGSNMGASDSLEVFHIYGQATTSSVEASRILVQFPITTVQTERTAGTIPASGSVSYYLKLTNAVHPMTVPKDYSLQVYAVSASWDEGAGLDMEQYKDTGFANWEYAASGSAWSSEGGDYHASPVFEQSFDDGTENLEVDITSLVEEWLAGDKSNYGVGIRLSGSLESGNRSYYTKKFFARKSEFFFARPVLEARWDSAILDDRDRFYASSSLVPSDENFNKLYLYNRFRGNLRNIPAVGTGSIYVSLFSGSTAPTGSELTLYDGSTAVTGAYVSTGIYSASLCVDTTLTTVFDVWHNNLTGSGRVEYFTGSAITVMQYTADSDYSPNEYVLNITNMKSIYNSDEKVRFKLYSRDKDWQPTIYTVAINEIEVQPLDDVYYKIFRVQDNYDVIPYGTGSDNHTRLSRHKDGNYFEVDTDLLEPGYSYGIKFVSLEDGNFKEHKETFKFRVE